MTFGPEIPNVQQGRPVSARGENTLRSVVRAIQASRGVNQMVGAHGILTRHQPQTAGVAIYRVAAIYDTYLRAQAWSGTQAMGPTIDIAKPRLLQPVLSHYPHLASLTLIDPQTVDVETLEGETGRWVVTPAYQVGDLIAAASRLYSLDQPLLTDLNEHGRAWCHLDDSEEGGV